MTVRYSEQPFPPYRYLPGRTPHPTRDPLGHSYNSEEPVIDSFDEAHWRNCNAYLYAIDLLNHGYWWEAHESLEALWLAAGQRHTTTGLFLQGLLQIGVGAMKQHLGQTSAAVRLWRAGLDKLNDPGEYFLGLNVHELKQAVRELIEGKREALPELVLHFD